MLRLVLALALAIFVCCPTVGVAEEPHVQAPAYAAYISVGEFGILTLFAQPGQEFTAWDLTGRTVAFGMVMMPGQPVPVFGAAPGPLTVRVGTNILFVDNTRDNNWQ